VTSGANGYVPVADEALSVAGKALLVVDEAVLAAGKTVPEEHVYFSVADNTDLVVGEAVSEGDGYFPVNSKEVLVVFWRFLVMKEWVKGTLAWDFLILSDLAKRTHLGSW
jgi:hypothetical protein